MKERLQKIISAHGITSRRKAEKLISQGRVTVNGVTAALGTSANAEADIIEIDGKPLTASVKHVYIALNKPRGYLTTVSDDRDRKTVMELVHDVGVRIYPAGRLDMDSSGLLIMTNDGDFANKITHPSNEKEKTYLVRVTGYNDNVLQRLSEPMAIDDYMIAPAKVTLVHNDGTSALLRFIIREGRNRQIRKMCKAADLDVISLHRVSIGNIKLSNLPSGKWRYLTDDEVASIKNS